MTSHALSAHPMLEPLDYELTPDRAASMLKGDLLYVYQLLWKSAVATAMDGPALREQLLEIRLHPAATLPESASGLVLQSIQEDCVDPGWRTLLPDEGALGKNPLSPFVYPFPCNLDESLRALPAGQRGQNGTRVHDGQACLGLRSLLPEVKEWRASKVNLTPGLSVDQLLEQMADQSVGRPSTFASTFHRALDNQLIELKDGCLEVGLLGRDILDDIALHPQIDALGASYSQSLDTALKSVEQDQTQAGRVLDEFSQRALGQSTGLAQWLDELVIEGESLNQALARAESRLPIANSWEGTSLPAGLAPQLLTRRPAEAVVLREEIDGLFFHADPQRWKRFSARERAACRVAILTLSDTRSKAQWLALVGRDIAWRYWVDLGPEESPLNDEDLGEALQHVQTLPVEIRMSLPSKAETAESFI
ncbi:UNVERIFIED_ORG: hypothetical protein J2X80_000972 [Pseudomonas fluorescens]|uniref:hypothetical protein n=1 Tax=Pseudomonas TaxID=286 RepID=UPI001C885AC6|nr:hypothetical protein [Pseudomonas sp. 3-2]MDP9708899.1 hypothetical protein [Pseudomonas fluorescens]QZD68691.1 hypothetical protein K3819_15650 [Pseudomonas sp. 3-2]